MKDNPLRTHTGVLLLAVSAAVTMGTGIEAAAFAGRVQFSHGNVQLQSATGSTRAARRGARLEAGDSVVTGKRGSAQVRMADGGMLAVRPGSRVKIDAFEFKGRENPGNRSFFSLLKGSFRSITGIIGKLRKQSFRINTPVATIGIRGSDADIGYDPGKKLAGVRTFAGEHTITSTDAQGQLVTLTTRPGQIALATAGSAPVYATSFPFRAPAPGAAGNKQSKRDKGKPVRRPPPPQGKAGSGAGRPGPRPGPGPGNVAGPRDGRVIVPIDSGNTNLQAPRLAPLGTGGVGADMFVTDFGVESGNGTIQVDGGGQQEMLIDGSGAVTGITDKSGGGFRFAAAEAKLVRNVGYGVRTASGALAARGNWGVWQGDFKVFDQSQRKSNLSGFHFVTASAVTAASAIQSMDGVAFSFSRLGGIVTNEVGALASHYAVTANGTFGSGPGLGVINVNVDADFASGSTAWMTSGSGAIKSLTGADGISLTGSCQACAAGNAVNGSSHGLFIGPKAQGLILGVGAADAQSGAAFTGSAVLQRD